MALLEPVTSSAWKTLVMYKPTIGFLAELNKKTFESNGYVRDQVELIDFSLNSRSNFVSFG